MGIDTSDEEAFSAEVDECSDFAGLCGVITRIEESEGGQIISSSGRPIVKGCMQGFISGIDDLPDNTLLTTYGFSLAHANELTSRYGIRQKYLGLLKARLSGLGINIPG